MAETSEKFSKTSKSASKGGNRAPAAGKATGRKKPETMTVPEGTILIKKYPNRRLYDTSSSAYIVLDDIVELVKSGKPFIIQDAKTGDDITRSILNQIIFEQETKPSNFHFPLEVQKQLISMYGDTYGAMVPDYLAESMNLFVSERSRMSQAVESVMGRNTQAMIEFSQNMARQNMEMFKRSWEVFGGMSGASDTENKTQNTNSPDNEPNNEKERSTELQEIQNQIDALQNRLKSLK